MNKTKLYTKPIAIVEDNDEFVRLLTALLDSVSLCHYHFYTAEDFLLALEQDKDQFGCLLCDVRLPGVSGLQLHQMLRERSIKLPVIFISGHGNIKMAVKTIQDGACQFLTKPINHQETLDTIFTALRSQEKTNTASESAEDFCRQANELTRREKQILALIAKGIAPKVIADKLTISRNTVEVHRATIMKKLAAPSVGILISRAAAAGFSYSVDG